MCSGNSLQKKKLKIFIWSLQRCNSRETTVVYFNIMNFSNKPRWKFSKYSRTSLCLEKRTYFSAVTTNKRDVYYIPNTWPSEKITQPNTLIDKRLKTIPDKVRKRNLSNNYTKIQHSPENIRKYNACCQIIVCPSLKRFQKFFHTCVTFLNSVN